MKNFLIWIAVSIGSLFGIHSQPATSTAIDVPVQAVQTQMGQSTEASQISDEQGVINIVTAMLNADRNAATFQDAENVVMNYASQGAIQQFQTGISKIPTSSLSAMQGYLLQADHAYPDPSSIKFAVTINGDVATATAPLPDTTTTQPNAPGKVIVSTFKNSITVPLQKENGQWKVVKIIMASKGTGSVMKASQ